MLDKYVASHPDFGYTINATIIATTDGLYQPALDQALAAGGKDNGPPGLRPHYHPDYYAAFVIDPNGHNIEAVCHRPE